MHSYELLQAIWRIQICARLTTARVRQAPAVRAGKGIGTPGKGNIDSNRGLHVLEVARLGPICGQGSRGGVSKGGDG